MRPVKTTWVVAIVACRDQVFRVKEDVAVETISLLSHSSPHSLYGVRILSLHSLSLPSDGSLQAIALCWHRSGSGVRVQKLLQRARRQTPSAFFLGRLLP